MQCRVCGDEILFRRVDGRYKAIHYKDAADQISSQGPSGEPVPGHQRRLRQKLEAECRLAETSTDTSNAEKGQTNVIPNGTTM